MSFSPQKGFITDRNNLQFHQLSGWLVSDDPTGEKAGCGDPGLAWLHLVCSYEAGWTYCQRTLEMAYGREMNIQFSGNSSGGHPCCQHANCTVLQNCSIVLCDELHILEWPFIVPSIRCRDVNTFLHNLRYTILGVWNISGIFYFSS